MYFIFHQCWCLDTADNAANYYSTKNDLWLNYNPLTSQVFELTDARLSSLHTAGTVYKNRECCSLERKKIKSLKWGNTIILCYLSPCEEHLVCMCVRGAWMCVCVCLYEANRGTLQSPAGFLLHGPLCCLIGSNLSGSRHGFFWLVTGSTGSAQEKTSLARVSHISLPGVSGIWGGGAQEREESSLSVHTCPFFIFWTDVSPGCWRQSSKNKSLWSCRLSGSLKVQPLSTLPT